MAKKYRVISAPFYRIGGVEHSLDAADVQVGDTVKANPDNGKPDSDGDISVLCPRSGAWQHISLDCLERIGKPNPEVVTVSALRQALRLLSDNDIFAERLLEVTRLIEKAGAPTGLLP